MQRNSSSDLVAGVKNFTARRCREWKAAEVSYTLEPRSPLHPALLKTSVRGILDRVKKFIHIFLFSCLTLNILPYKYRITSNITLFIQPLPLLQLLRGSNRNKNATYINILPYLFSLIKLTYEKGYLVVSFNLQKLLYKYIEDPI